jgi:4-amino-4-deoxy-L-arabinose transferase-like glycosyltransferase
MPDRQREQTQAIVLALLTLLFHVLTAKGYGYFRDELYYIACSEHLALGYVDHPPLIALVTWLSRGVLGDSLYALRLFPAVCAAGTVYLTASITRDLGGGRFAQWVAAIAAALAPIYLSLFTILSMNALDVFLWTLALWIVTHILKTGNLRWWLAFGIVAGLGLQNKLSILFLGFGVVVGLVISRDWRHFVSPWLWAAGLLAALIFAPYLWWQSANGWPTLEFMQNARLYKNLPLSPLDFLTAQAEMMNIVALPLWLAGLGFYFFARDGRPYRAFGWMYLAVLLIMITQRAKPYYLAPIYPVFLAAGALVLERLASRPGWTWMRFAAPALLVLSGATFAPLAKPLLPVDTYVAYAAALGHQPSTGERKELARLPQFFADMHGWPEMVATVAEAYDNLPPEDRERACFFGQNYGQAGAVDFFGAAAGLPKAISAHNAYFLWGPGECSGEVILAFDDDSEGLEAIFHEVEQVGVFTCKDCMPYENNQKLWVGREPRVLIEDAWERTKNYN